MIVPNRVQPKNDYPTRDGRPMGETQRHWLLMVALIETLNDWYAADEMVYVHGNLLIFYDPGNRRRHVSPDVFVVKEVPKVVRDNFLVWEEGHAPHLVIELTSASTRDEDLETKFELYQNVLRVTEYFLFDPREEYLTPSMQGYRLQEGQYVAIEPVDGRLPSEVLSLHLERQGEMLRLYNTATGEILLTPREDREQEKARVEQEKARIRREKARTRKEKARAEQEKARADQATARADEAATENERLRREIEELRRRSTEQ